VQEKLVEQEEHHAERDSLKDTEESIAKEVDVLEEELKEDSTKKEDHWEKEFPKEDLSEFTAEE